MRRFSPGKKRFCACFFLGISGFLCVSTSQTFLFEENGLQKQACWHICGCTHRHRPESRQLNQRNCIAASQHGQFQCLWGINPGTKQLTASFYQSTSRLVLEKHRPTKPRGTSNCHGGPARVGEIWQGRKQPSLVECSNVRCGDLQ